MQASRRVEVRSDLAAGYGELLEALERIAAAERAPDESGPLARSSDALHAVVKFLSSDPSVRDGALARPLGRLLSAIDDKLLGGNPTLFASQRKRDSEDRAKRGRASRRSFDALRAMVNIATKHELGAKEPSGSRSDVFRRVAKTLEHAGVRDGRGSLISGKTVERWWLDKGGQEPPAATEALNTLQPLYDTVAEKAPAPKRLLKAIADRLYAVGF